MLRLIYLLPALAALHLGASWPDAVPDAMLEQLGKRAVVAAAPWHRERVRATVFGQLRSDGTRDGGTMRFTGQRLTDTDRCIAHRTLPGLTPVWVTYEHPESGPVRLEAYVCDRGTYGCDLAPGEEPAPDQERYRGDGPWLCTKPHHRGTHRSDIDLSVDLARALGYPGKGWVVLEWQ